MSPFRHTLTAVAVASTLAVAACGSGQDHSAAGQPAASSTSAVMTAPLTADQVSVQMAVQGAPMLSVDGNAIEVTVNLANHGETTLSSKGTKPVNLGAHSVDANGKIIDMDLARAPIPDIAPGSQTTVTIQLPVAQVSGHSAQILPVQEGVAWFDNWGTKPLTVGPFKPCRDSAICGADGKPLTNTSAH